MPLLPGGEGISVIVVTTETVACALVGVSVDVATVVDLFVSRVDSDVSLYCLDLPLPSLVVVVNDAVLGGRPSTCVFGPVILSCP